MDELQIKCEKPISNSQNLKFCGMAFDGCHFYLTCPQQSKIIKYSEAFCEKECIETAKPYAYICYDWERNCFWATLIKCNYRVFKLDLDFQEIDFITVAPYENCGNMIKGVSFECCNGNLWVAYEKGIISIDVEKIKGQEMVRRFCGELNTGVLSIAPSYIITELKDRRQRITLYDECHQPVTNLRIPESYVVDVIIFCPNVLSCNKKHSFCALAIKNGCYAYILEWSMECCDVKICHCNYGVCKKKCDEKEPCGCSYNDIMESIALIEVALSHVLNAEGEKLQKIIAISNDVDTILCANKAINETIVNVTHLEIVLHNKLLAAGAKKD